MIKQLLLIMIDAVVTIESQSDYSNFEWEVHFHWDQDWYEWVTEDCSQLFYSAQAYHTEENLISDDENDQTQDNQNSESNQEKSE